MMRINIFRQECCLSERSEADLKTGLLLMVLIFVSGSKTCWMQWNNVCKVLWKQSSHRLHSTFLNFVYTLACLLVFKIQQLIWQMWGWGDGETKQKHIWTKSILNCDTNIFKRTGLACIGMEYIGSYTFTIIEQDDDFSNTQNTFDSKSLFSHVLRSVHAHMFPVFRVPQILYYDT